MTKVTFFQKSSGEIVGFDVKDHAGSGEEGQDIVCAAVSALTITIINSIERFVKLASSSHTDEENAGISFRLRENPTHDSELLLRTLIEGMTEISEEYPDFIDLLFVEV